MIKKAPKIEPEPTNVFLNLNKYEWEEVIDTEFLEENTRSGKCRPWGFEKYKKDIFEIMFDKETSEEAKEVFWERIVDCRITSAEFIALSNALAKITSKHSTT